MEDVSLKYWAVLVCIQRKVAFRPKWWKNHIIPTNTLSRLYFSISLRYIVTKALIQNVLMISGSHWHHRFFIFESTSTFGILCAYRPMEYLWATVALLFCPHFGKHFVRKIKFPKQKKFFVQNTYFGNCRDVFFSFIFITALLLAKRLLQQMSTLETFVVRATA